MRAAGGERNSFASGTRIRIAIEETDRYVDGSGRSFIAYIIKLAKRDSSVRVPVRNFGSECLRRPRSCRNNILQLHNRAGDCIGEAQLIKRSLPSCTVTA